MDSSMEKLSFKKVPREERQADVIRRPASTYLKDAWYSLRRNPLGMVGGVVIVIMLFLAIFGPMLSPYAFDQQDLKSTYAAPGSEHWMGQDNLGRDVMVRVFYGARTSLTVGVVSSLIALLIGVLYGAISGYAGGRVDMIMMRIVEIVDSVPSTLYVIMLSQVFPDSGVSTIIVVIGITAWMGTARLVRGEVLSLKTREYVLAAQVSGLGDFKIIRKHLIPNTINSIVVSLTLSIPSAIFMEAALRFLGIMTSSTPSWGSMSSDGVKALSSYPHLIIFPALFISLTILAFNLLADALQKAFDPKKR